MGNGQNIMFLVANGFVEKDLLALQRAMISGGNTVKLVSSEKNLVNGFNNGEWGLTFPVDEQIDSTLAADYDALVVVGGEQSVSRLVKNLHSQRIIEAFIETSKPMVMINEAQKLVEGQIADNIVLVNADTEEEIVDQVSVSIMPVEGIAQAA